MTSAIQVKSWSLATLAELVSDTRSGFASGERDDNGIVQVRMNNVDTSGLLDLTEVIRVPASTKQVADFSLRPGDVLFNNTNSTELVGKSAIFRGHIEPVVFSNHFTRIRVREDQLEPRYLTRWLTFQQRLGVFTGLCTRWVNQSAVRVDKLLGLNIPIPPLSEQKRIADILDKADAIRRKRQDLVFTAKNVLPAVFAGMFGTNGDMYPTESLDRHLQFLTSGSRGWAQYYVSAGKRFIRSLDVQMNRIGEDDSAFVDPPKGTEAERTRVRDGDVLITITGSKIGRVAFVPNDFGEAYVSQHVAIARLLPSLLPRYCSMFLSLPGGGQRQIAKAQYGQTKPGISLTNIREFQIPIPPLALQTRFVSLCAHHDTSMTRLRHGLCEAERLFASLVQRGFRGEL